MRTCTLGSGNSSDSSAGQGFRVSGSEFGMQVLDIVFLGLGLRAKRLAPIDRLQRTLHGP